MFHDSFGDFVLYFFHRFVEFQVNGSGVAV